MVKKQKKTSATAQKIPPYVAPENPSQPGTSEWFYDEIMRHIEPDLLSTVIPHHAEIYEKETEEEKKARMKAYDEAFFIYDQVADEFAAAFAEDMRGLRKEAREQAVREDTAKSGETIKGIESQIDEA